MAGYGEPHLLVLTVTRGPDAGKRLPLEPNRVYTVGSGEDSLPLSDPRVLSPHCSLKTDGQGRILLQNETASAGTFVGDRKIARGLIKPGMAFRVGDSVLVVQKVVAKAPSGSPSPNATPAGEGGTGSRRRRVIDQQNDPLLGKIVAGYKLNEVVGRGGMGTVYKATQLSLHREVAVKVLRPSLAKDESFRQLFINEARAAAQLVDPNVVQVYDAGTEGEISFFSMEYIGQGSVEEILEADGKIPWEEAILMVLEAAHGLLYAENKGIVHRDIKPDNLMINDDGRIKIADLGLAKKGEGAKDEGIIGTPHFIPPEQALGKDVDVRADIYSLGCTFFRMITGRTVFQGKTAKEIVLKHVKEPAPAASSLEKGVPDDLDLVLARMMAKDPGARHQSASELISALEEVCANHGIKGSIIKKGISKKVLIPAIVVVLVAGYFAWDLIEKSARQSEIAQQSEEEAKRLAEQREAEREAADREAARAQRLSQITLQWSTLDNSYYRLDNQHPIDDTYQDPETEQQLEQLWLDKADEFATFAGSERLEEFEDEHGFARRAEERAEEIRERLQKLKESALDMREWRADKIAKVEEIDKRLRLELDRYLREGRYEQAYRFADRLGNRAEARGAEDPFHALEGSEWVSPTGDLRRPVAGFKDVVAGIQATRKFFADEAAIIPAKAEQAWQAVRERASALDEESPDADIEAVIDDLREVEDTFCDGEEPHQEQIQGYVEEALELRRQLTQRLEQRRLERIQRDRNLVRDILRVQASLDPQVSPNNVMRLEIGSARDAYERLLSEGGRQVESEPYRRYLQQRLGMLDWIEYLFRRWRADLIATLDNRGDGPLVDLDFELPKEPSQPRGDTLRARLEAPMDGLYVFTHYPKYNGEEQRSFGAYPLDWVYEGLFHAEEGGERVLRWRDPDPALHFALGAFCFETMQFAAARRHFEAAAADARFAAVAPALAKRAAVEQAAYADYVEILRGVGSAERSEQLETLRQRLEGYRDRHEGTRFWIEVMPRSNDDVRRDFVDGPSMPELPPAPEE